MTAHLHGFIVDALTAAAALEVLQPAPDGAAWTAACTWCLNAADPHERCHSRRFGGFCIRCRYVGADVHAALLPLDQTPLPWVDRGDGTCKRWPERPLPGATDEQIVATLKGGS